MKMSSSVKVGILAILALIIFFCTVLWVKGRAFSSSKRIEVRFKDVNGMRPGSGVQMMGMRVGQVEVVKPVIDGENSYVLLKFVITQPNLTIPKASTISIQQSGLIGEQFLEITPPKIQEIYLPVYSKDALYDDAKVEMKLDDKYYDVGVVKKTNIISRSLVPILLQPYVNTAYSYKVSYIINMPGLVLPKFMLGEISGYGADSKLRIHPLDNSPMPYPNATSPYTIAEPMRIATFLDLQYQAAASLTETNKKVNALLDDSLIADIKQTVHNVKILTANASTTLEKTEKLIDESRKDLDIVMNEVNTVSKEFCTLSHNVNNIISDPQFKPTMFATAKSIGNLSDKLAPILGAVDSKKFAEDLNVSMSNLAQITATVNTMTKDEKLKTKLETTVDNLNRALYNVSLTLETVNNTKDDKNIKNIVEDTAVTVHNLRKFSDKLNRRFLLFRLMF